MTAGDAAADRESSTGTREMTPDSKITVKRSWALVLPIADAAAVLFYNRLFEIDPSTRPLFAHTNPAEQRRKLMLALNLAVEGLDDLDRLVPVIEGLGRRHVAYGVTDGHYHSVGVALLWTLEQGLGAVWTKEMATAWTEAYALLSGVMRQAASGMPAVLSGSGREAA
jgi:hemoglobin-like flavoprotein